MYRNTPVMRAAAVWYKVVGGSETRGRSAKLIGAQPVAPRGCLCPSLARTHRTLATLPHAVSEAGSRERFVLRRSM